MTSETTVRVYQGLGTQKKVAWSGKLDFIPRIGDNVVLNEMGYTVDRIHHWLPGGTQKREIDIYVR